MVISKFNDEVDFPFVFYSWFFVVAQNIILQNVIEFYFASPDIPNAFDWKPCTLGVSWGFCCVWRWVVVGGVLGTSSGDNLTLAHFLWRGLFHSCTFDATLDFKSGLEAK